MAPAEAAGAAAKRDSIDLGRDSVAFVVVDDDCRCLDVSEEACRVLSAVREEIVGAKFGELLSDDARECFTHVWRAFRKAGGHAGPFRISATPVEVDVSVTADMLPSRHVVLLSPSAAGPLDGGSETSRGRSAGRRFDSKSQMSPTAREREILRLLASGATDCAIAERLSLSPATVRTHVRNAKSRLNASTRAQAVAIALGRGIIG